MIGVYRAQPGSSEAKPVSFVAHSNRKIKPSVLCNVFLDPGDYVIGMEYFSIQTSIYYEKSRTHRN